MEEAKLAYLEKENLRLNKLIDILINQNDALQAKITYLEKGAPQTQLISDMPENETGRDQLFSGSPQKVSGKEQLFSDSPEKEIGTNQSFSTSPETEIGRVHVQSGGQENEQAKEQLPKPLPYFIPLTGENIQKVQNSMGAGFWFRVKQDARWAMSQILIQAYNKQGCSYTELGKLTHRSAGGMAKLIASLKKRGLVERSGKSSFRLTELTLNYIRKADCNLQAPDYKP